MTELPLFPEGGPRFEIRPHPHVGFDGFSPVVEGTRVPVRRLWQMHKSEVPFAKLFARYPNVPRAHLLSAISFAYDNADLIEWDLVRADPG